MRTEKKPGELAGQLAVITGAARGLGRAMAETLAGLGADIVSIDLVDSGETLAAVEKTGARASAYIGDLTQEQQVGQVFQRIMEERPQIDILINNAGFYSVPRRPFWELDAAEWDRVMAINVRPVFLCARAVSKPMREAGAGRIINMSSNVISFGMPGLMHYVAAKSAVAGMTCSMARELGPYGICVNAVAPGLTATQTAIESIGQDALEQAQQEQCLREPLQPGDIASTVAFLCGPGARMISGQTLLVNGGATVSR